MINTHNTSDAPGMDTAQELALLRKKVAMYEAAIASFPNAAILLFDQDYRYVAIGGDTVADIGIDRDEMLGKDAHSSFPADMNEHLHRLFSATLHGEYVRDESIYNGKTFSASYVPLHDKAAGVHAGLIVAHNVTDERKAQQERKQMLLDLAAHEQELSQFKNLIDHAPTGIAIADQDSTIRYANQAFAEMTGLHDAAVGNSYRVLFGPETSAWAQQEVIPHLLQSGYWTGRVPGQRPDGTAWIAQAAIHVLKDTHADQQRWVMFLQDVSDRELDVKRISENEALLRAVTENLPVMLSVLDQNGVYQLSTGRGLRDIGLEPGQLVGQSVWEVLANNEQQLNDARRVIAGETIEVQHIYKGVSFDSYATPFLDQQGVQRGIIVIATNVSDRVRTEQEHFALQEQIISTQESLLRELSTPLIPLTDDVVVMPLIGTIDSHRARTVLETLLEGVSQNKAQTVILDITGVPLVDTQVANVLIQAAQALKLLGADVLLTGIRPEVAQTLVSLGTNLVNIQTRSNLQSAIRAVLK